MIIVKRRSDKVPVIHFILSCLAITRTYPTIFDTSALVATNMTSIGQHLPSSFLQRSTTRVPYGDPELPNALSELTATETSAFLIEDLNALLYLMSPTGNKSALRYLSSLFHLLAYAARINHSFVFGTVYKRETGNQSMRSLTNISDVQLDAEVRNNLLHFSSTGVDWPSGRFTAPVYLDWST